MEEWWVSLYGRGGEICRSHWCLVQALGMFLICARGIRLCRLGETCRLGVAAAMQRAKDQQ
jgi:hypothetical protein